MIKDNQTLLNRIHVVVDALVIACTYIAAWFIQFEFFAPDVAGKLPLETYMSALVILIPGLLLLYHAFSLYTPKRVHFLCTEHRCGNAGAESDPYGADEPSQTRAEPETNPACRLQPGGRAVYRPYHCESAVGLLCPGHLR